MAVVLWSAYLVFSLLNCTVYVLDEALLPLRLPLCSCSVQLLQSEIVTTVAAAAADGDVGGCCGCGCGGVVGAKMGEYVTLLAGVDRGICKATKDDRGRLDQG